MALWSRRPTEWRRHDPTVTPTGGLTEPFDLVASGGADNEWVVEVGRAADWDSFEAFVDAVTSATVTVDENADGTVDVAYESPSVGAISYRTAPTQNDDGELTVAGTVVTVGDHPRMDAPWASVDAGASTYEVAFEGNTLSLDLATGERVVG